MKDTSSYMHDPITRTNLQSVFSRWIRTCMRDVYVLELLFQYEW